jgi:hypothetical protein
MILDAQYRVTAGSAKLAKHERFAHSKAERKECFSAQQGDSEAPKMARRRVRGGQKSALRRPKPVVLGKGPGLSGGRSEREF